jgi:hypothetical protein
MQSTAFQGGASCIKDSAAFSFDDPGPASIVLGLVYLEQEMHLPGESTIRFAVEATVLLSIFAHGLSAMPGIGLYARKTTSLAADAPEHRKFR